MAIPRLDPVCWALILQDLCTGRLNVNGLARELDIPRSTLRGWIEGQQPGHSDGERLLEYWIKATGKSREQIPRERQSLSAADFR